jgi:hypothetical protein
MTTGRINQVTTFRNTSKGAAPLVDSPSRGPFTAGVFRQQGYERLDVYNPHSSRRQPSAMKRTSQSTAHYKTSLFLDLTGLRLRSPGPVKTRITAFDEDYQQPAFTYKVRTVTADPRVVSCEQV